MGTISLTSGESYAITKVNGDPVITRSTDFVNRDLTIRRSLRLVGNDSHIYVSASNSGPGGGSRPALMYIGDYGPAGNESNWSSQGSGNDPFVMITTNRNTVYSGYGTHEVGAIYTRDMFGLMLNNRNTTVGSMAGLGFTTSTELSDNDAVGAAIIAQRNSVAGVTAGNHHSDMIFAVNNLSDDDLMERMRITYDGDVQMRNRLIIGDIDYLNANDAKKLHIIAAGTVDDTFVLQGSGTNGSSQIHMGISSTSGYYGIMKLTDSGFDFKTTSGVRPIRLMPNQVNVAEFDDGGIKINKDIDMTGKKFARGGSPALYAKNTTSAAGTAQTVLRLDTGFTYNGDNGNAQAVNYIVFKDGAGNTKGAVTGRDNSFGTVNYVDNSDRRLKSNIRNSQTSIDDLMQVKIRDFEWKGYTAADTGVIAQELLDTPFSALVHDYTDSNEAGGFKEGDEDYMYHGVAYHKFIPYLIKSLQDCYTEINTLKQELKDLKDR